MVWCLNCSRDCRGERDYASGCICCSECGKVLSQPDDEIETFVKVDGGGSRFAGNHVRSFESDYSRALENGKRQIRDLMYKLEISDGSLGNAAIKFYTMALERSFTRGRRTSHVAAACLYTACRVNDKPYLLIDLAVWLSVNVYVLGAVYLQLCKVLSFNEHGFVQKPVDPSLFMHRFASALLKGGCEYERRRVGRTALKIVGSMKRDWMQTGRKPSGICGAALYISSLSHGFSHSKSDVVKIVHICEATLTKRLVEFENTASGSLTIEEFEKIAEDFDKENSDSKEKEKEKEKEIEMLCQHKGKQPHFAHGLCRNCYNDFIQLSGGLNYGGSEPPAFQQAELQRLTQPSNLHGDGGSDPQQDIENFEGPDERGEGDTIAPAVSDESDSLSDIDDMELKCYLNNPEEIHKKTIIWEIINKEYLQEQAAKEADGVLAARKLPRQKKRPLESKNADPAKTPADIIRQMLTKKGLSSKINYHVLDKLFDDTPVATSTKKSRTDSYDDDHPFSRQVGNNKEGNQEEIAAFVKDAGEEEEEEEEESAEEYGFAENAEFYNGNAEEMYNYDNGQDNWDDDEF